MQNWNNNYGFGRTELIINSGDRTSGTSADFWGQLRTDSIKMSNNLMPNKCKIVGINFANTVYNVNTNNNVITIFETTASSNTVITLPQGQYTAVQLANQIATSFTSASQVTNTYTATYNAQTYLLTITANTHTFYFVNTSLLLGMMNNSTASLTQTSTQSIKLLFDFYYVRCDLIEEIKNTSQTNTPGSFIIPLNNINVGSVGFIGRNQLPSTIHTFYPKQTFRVTIYDQFGNVVNLNNYDWQIIIELWTENN